jgi:hypothetical protein
MEPPKWTRLDNLVIDLTAHYIETSDVDVHPPYLVAQRLDQLERSPGLSSRESWQGQSASAGA